MNRIIEKLLFSTPLELVFFFSLFIIIVLFFIEIINIKKIGIILFICSKIPLVFIIKYNIYVLYPIVNIFLLVIVLKKKEKRNLLLKIFSLFDYFIFYICLLVILFLRYLSN